MLIMDEPSSVLHPRAEDALFQAIRDRRGLGITILITHRLANVRHLRKTRQGTSVRVPAPTPTYQPHGTDYRCPMASTQRQMRRTAGPAGC
ncbi:hypothetical protein C1I93_05235 [Micromonospora endophytica]|uniref:Uncharacterized protein n=1 Tax=Micromonospora endophytica TaxID=515350 RepID=A0A2W2CNU8_9ACTN|nr:hypothetical protein C1I93_05235 [Micromonospora endophytica]RIW40814.1 hypothetical protein D3H59_28180 [Micromonospora endophytica]BCJ57016.1 hypothetical protein Jiend_04380 [Micromonospora endophytica]